MALTLTQLQAYRDALITALGSPTLEVSFEGRTKRYKTTAEIQQALTIVNSQIANNMGGTRIRQRRAYLGSKGY